MNELCKLLDIKYPIIQGGMAWLATAELAAAVSEAGGLGIIAAGNAPADYVREQIIKIRKITSKPFGVNIMLLSPFVEDVMQVIYDERVPVITTGAGNPAKYIEKLKLVGTKVIPVVPTTSLGKRMEKYGADAIIVEGTEAGGHIGELTTMVLLPEACENIKIPVIAAGGIMDGKTMLAAFTLGAKGVQVGTRFICSYECVVHENYKKAVINAKERDAIVTGRSTGHPVRALKNKLAKEILHMEKENASSEEIDQKGIGSLRKAVVEGDAINGSIMAGQVAGRIGSIDTCQEIIDAMIQDFYKQKENVCKFEI